MKKIIILLIATICLVACNSFSGKETEKSTEVGNLKSALKASENTVTELRIDTAELNSEIRCMKGEKSLPDCGCNKKAPVRKTKAQKIVKKAPAKTSQITITEEPTTPVQEIRVVKRISAGTPNLSYLREGGEIIFCTQANDREDCYFPHYAIQQGITFSNFQNNQMKGYNWKVEPTDGYQGDYGVTKDGTFYVSVSLIQRALQKGGLTLQGALKIKCPYTSWIAKPMTQEGNFWIYRTRN